MIWKIRCRGYYEDTEWKNTKKIQEYIQQSDRGRPSRGTTDDGEYLSRITVGKERNSCGCQTVLARRDAPASIKGLCPSMKNSRLYRGLLLI
ncbi:hypothetical protein CLOSTMETH_00724 [[Clostridium] methylpentosum DSM 5476]|uniref:Uncharacterized protein n=1 Tax=[Clostridium] methylpentosum DSM 5476 TaxID=537013 RepID=C0EA70_9FIRM|nr:hypothetical protein CLOSTMETH_00724 [[Clostridium] methylpentosum DSM 5476]